MGLAASPKRRPEDNWAIIYYPPSPRAMIEVVDPDDPWKLVEYGKTGRTRLTTLTKEFFMPRFLERDECERERRASSIRGTACGMSGRSHVSRRVLSRACTRQASRQREQGSRKYKCFIYQFFGGVFRIAASIKS